MGFKVIGQHGLQFQLVKCGDKEVIHARGAIEKEGFEIRGGVTAQTCEVKIASYRPEFDAAPPIICQQISLILHEADGLAICGDRRSDAFPEWRNVAVADAKHVGARNPGIEEQRGKQDESKGGLP